MAHCSRPVLPAHGRRFGRTGTALVALGVTVAALSGCTAAVSAARVTAAPDPLGVVQGTWVFTTKDSDLQASGVSDAGVVDENAGATVITIRGRHFRVASAPQAGYDQPNPTGSGELTSANGTVTIHWSTQPDDRTRFVPHRSKAGQLTFTGLRSFENDPQSHGLDRATFARRPWRPLSAAIEGRWTTDLTAQELRLGGVPAADARASTLTLTLGAGRWSLRRTTSTGADAPTASGVYRLQDGLLTIRWSGEPGATTTATVIPTAEGGLVFRDVKEGTGRAAGEAAYDRAALGADTWSAAH